VTTFNDKGFETKVRTSITEGKLLIIENVQEELEPTLDPVLTRAITTKNKKM